MFKGVLLPIFTYFAPIKLKENHAIGDRRGRTHLDRQLARVVEGSSCEDISFRIYKKVRF